MDFCRTLLLSAFNILMKNLSFFTSPLQTLKEYLMNPKVGQNCSHLTEEKKVGKGTIHELKRVIKLKVNIIRS